MKKLFFIASLSVAAFAYTDCTMCHGTMTGTLDKYSPKEIIKKMKEFKAGKGNPMMVNVAQGMSDKEIKEAAYKYGKK